ncbi:MAG: hypothetical protein AAF772_03630 [Acidobacteriota bacterium]
MTASIASVVAANVRAGVHLLLDQLPTAIVRTDVYRAARQRLSPIPIRFARIGARPAPMQPAGWTGRRLVQPGTDLVLDGFPGSGNSFTAESIRLGMTRPIHFESHFNQAVQLRRAVAYGVPTLVIVRDPHGACRSLKSKDPRVADALIVLRWIAYHRVVLRFLRAVDDPARFGVVDFADVIADLDVARRRFPALDDWVAGRPLVGDSQFQRRSSTRVPLALDAWPIRGLLASATHLHAAIRDCDAAQRAR